MTYDLARILLCSAIYLYGKGNGTSKCCCPSVCPSLPFTCTLFSNKQDRSSSKSINIVFKQQQQHHPTMYTPGPPSSIDGAEALNNDLQRVSEFLLHDINPATFTTRLHNNKSLAFICLDSNSKGMVSQPTITQQQQQQQQLSSSRHRLALTIVRFSIPVILSWILVNYYSTTTTITTTTTPFIALSPSFRYRLVFAFISPLHGFHSTITRQQQPQQQIFFVLSPCFRYCLAPAIIRFRIHVALSWIFFNYYMTKTTFITLSSCFRYQLALAAARIHVVL